MLICNKNKTSGSQLFLNSLIRLVSIYYHHFIITVKYEIFESDKKKVLILNAPVETKMQTIWFCVRSQLWVLRSVSICLSSIYHTAWRNLVVSIFFIGFSHPFFAMKHRVVHFVSFPFYKRIEYLNMEHW